MNKIIDSDWNATAEITERDGQPVARIHNTSREATLTARQAKSMLDFYQKIVAELEKTND